MNVTRLDIGQVADAAARLRELVNRDDADLRLVRVDVLAGVVALELDLSAAGCSDCVLPPVPLRDMVDAALKNALPGDYDVQVLDPRTSTPSAHAADRSASTPEFVTVVDPGSEPTVTDFSPGPDAGPLTGKVVGFRIDSLWRSWDWVVDEWCATLTAAGVTTTRWRRIQGLDGARANEARAEYEAFLDSVDAAIVGMANCGSCTSWTIRDAVTAVNREHATVAVITAHFEQLGRTLASHYGRPRLRMQILPYPLETRSEPEVRQIARNALPQVLAALGGTV